MAELTDHELLTRFARHADQDAFTALVARKTNLIWSAALRFTRDPHHAEEVTQAVILILAEKAGRISPQTVLTGWLYQTARLTAANFLKENRRRQQREHQAYLESAMTPNETNEAWQQLAPVLDDAMHALRTADRDAVLLRYFENKSLADVGAALGVSEDAARVRVNRALDKLHALLAKQGIKFGGALLATAVAENSVQAAPAALLAKVSVIAAKGAATTSSISALVKGALKTIAWIKAQTIVLVGVSVLLAAVTTTVLVKELSLPKITDEMWMVEGDAIKQLPPVLILRRSHFQGQQMGFVQRGEKRVWRNVQFELIFPIAYPLPGPARCVQLVPLPNASYSWENPMSPQLTNGFDLMMTLTNQPHEALRQEIKNQLGIVAHREIIETNVLLLKIVKTGASGLKPVNGRVASIDNAAPFKSSSGYSVKNAETLKNMITGMEAVLKIPILDRTGLNGFYDITLKLDGLKLAAANGDPKKWMEIERQLIDKALLDQLGLELVPSREPIEMLVVEKVK